MTDSRVTLRFQDGIAVLTLCRADKRNALDAAMVETLATHCRRIEASDARVVILTGEGSRSFCAGGDIGAWSDLTPDAFARHWVRDGHTAFDALARLAQPVIAVLNGDCLGGGLELAACADLRLAEAHVHLALPEAGLGIIPGWSGTQRAVRRFGATAIRRMALFGEMLDAPEALRLGLVDAVVPSGQGMQAALQRAADLCARSAVATGLCKMLINAAEGEERDRVLEAMAGHIAAGSADLAEGLAAYRARRAPNFGTGKGGA